MEALRYLPYVNKKGWVVTNINPFVNIQNYPDMKEVIKELEKIDNLVALDMDKIAKDLGSPRSSNMVLLGASSPFLGLDIELLEDGIKKFFQAKGEKIVDLNVKSFYAGREEALNFIKERKISL